jgi:hypothetical protein
VVTATVNIADMLSVKSIAKQLGMTSAGVRGWGKRGVKVHGVVVKLHIFKFGGNWYTTKQDWQAFAEAQQTGKQSTPEANWLTEQQQTAKALKGDKGERKTNRRRRVSGVRKPADAADAASVTEHEPQ